MFEAFVVVLTIANVLPILPIVLQFTAGFDPPARRSLLLQAVVVGNLVAVAAALGGGLLLRATRLTIDDLRIAGGLILLVFATYDLLFNREQRKRPVRDQLRDPAASSLVPMAVPVLVGPATLATVMVVGEDHGTAAVLVAIGANAVINAALLLAADRVIGAIGPGVGRAFGKVMSLILATMAVSMVRLGVAGAIARGVTP
ncbi:MAG: MarC family protein [Kofleriaceae bacterium]